MSVKWNQSWLEGGTYSDLPLQALLLAVWRRKPKTKVYVHSDQGCQFSSYEWQEFLEQGCVSIVVEILLRRPPSGLICA